MNKKKRQIIDEHDKYYFNMEGTAFAQKDGTFIEGFDENQEKLILDWIKHYKPYEVIAYASLPYDNMRMIDKYGFIDPPGPERVSFYKLWKITHTDLTAVKTIGCMIALTYGVELVEIIDNISEYNDEIIALVGLGFSFGVNIIKYIDKHTTVDEVLDLLEKKTRGKYTKKDYNSASFSLARNT